MIKIKTRSIIGIALPLVMASCAPSVTTELKQTLAPRVTASQVHLYDVGETTPADAEYIVSVQFMLIPLKQGTCELSCFSEIAKI